MEQNNVNDDSCSVADFGTPVDSVNSSDLSVGDEVKLTYEPGRIVIFRYLGNNWFEVVDRENNQLQVGDHLLIKEFDKYHAYYAWEVIRGEENLGNYTAARFNGGIRTLFVKSAEQG